MQQKHLKFERGPPDVTLNNLSISALPLLLTINVGYAVAYFELN